MNLQAPAPVAKFQYARDLRAVPPAERTHIAQLDAADAGPVPMYRLPSDTALPRSASLDDAIAAATTLSNETKHYDRTFAVGVFQAQDGQFEIGHLGSDPSSPGNTAFFPEAFLGKHVQSVSPLAADLKAIVGDGTALRFTDVPIGTAVNVVST